MAYQKQQQRKEGKRSKQGVLSYGGSTGNEPKGTLDCPFTCTFVHKSVVSTSPPSRIRSMSTRVGNSVDLLSVLSVVSAFAFALTPKPFD